MVKFPVKQEAYAVIIRDRCQQHNRTTHIILYRRMIINRMRNPPLIQIAVISNAVTREGCFSTMSPAKGAQP